MSSYLPFMGAALVVLLIPGLGVMYVVTRSVNQGRRAGLLSVLGLTSGALVHVVAATLGLSVILLTSAAAFGIIKILGAGYLDLSGFPASICGAGPCTHPTAGAGARAHLHRHGADHR